jgi:hypothetical protein
MLSHADGMGSVPEQRPEALEDSGAILSGPRGRRRDRNPK